MSETAIQRLDESTVARIAAGEVVERPASAVKELVENSLDAGASRIDVAIEAGGIDGIRVSDDGHGMSRADLRAAVREHTTSKITSLDDLESRLETLGFRGEALHAIAAVSRLSIESRPPDGDAGTRLEAVGGTVESVEPTGCPPGTSVTVEELFFNTPARRKFLKAEATEFGHVNQVVTRYALANPDVAVRLEHDGREVFATTGQGDLESAVLAVYGREVAEAMVDLDSDVELPEGPLESVEGLVSHPETTRSSRKYMATFVNGRAIRSEAVVDGVMAAYGRQLAPDRYPFVVLFLTVDAAAVDVNVHPRKRKVRFADEAGVREQVTEAVETTLLEAGLVRSSAPRGKSAPSETSVTPGGHGESRRRSTATSTTRSPTTRTSRSSSTSSGPTRTPQQRTLAGGAVSAEPDLSSLPDLRVLGQLSDTYVVCAAPEGLWLVDQHAADERVNFERLQAAVGDAASQALATPVELELTAAEADGLSALLPALESLGFRASSVGERTVQVEAVPAVLDTTVPPERLRDVLGEVLTESSSHDTPGETLRREILADLACYPSITGNTSLTEGSVLELLEALDGCENPYACPHGRPVLVEIDEAEIEARFERDYPGHA